MEWLVKIGISVGIVLAVMIIFLVGVTIIPQVLYNSPLLSPQYPQELSEEDAELVQSLNQTESYRAFVERFPDNVETFNTWPHGGNIQLTAVNTDKNTMLTLHLNYDSMSKRIHVDVNCQLASMIDHGGFHANGGAVPEFIRTTTCLD